MHIKSQTHKFFSTVKKNLYNSNLNLVKNNDKILTYSEAKEKVSKIIYKLKKIKKKKLPYFQINVQITMFPYWQFYLVVTFGCRFHPACHIIE